MHVNVYHVGFSEPGSEPMPTLALPKHMLHILGYTKKVTGKTAEERLDLRSASKADKFCK